MTLLKILQTMPFRIKHLIARRLINDNDFVHCAAVPDADPLYPYFGAESRSAVVLSFAETVSAAGNSTGDDPRCFARKEHSSTKDVVVK